jgi:hypothetical protein
MCVCVYMHVCVCIGMHTLCTCHIKLFVAHRKHTHETISAKQCFQYKATAQRETDIRVRVFNTGLLAKSQFASGRSCDRPTRLRFSVVFLGPRANAELVPKFHVASHAALPTVTSNFRLNVALPMLI